MRALALSALAAATIGVVAFVFVELQAARSPSATTATPATTTSLPPPSPSANRPSRIAPSTTAPVTRDMSDPLDHVVDGRSKRDWRRYYAEQQQRTVAELDRWQQTIEDASDPAQLKDAYQHVRELREQMKRDLEDLARIENTP